MYITRVTFSELEVFFKKIKRKKNYHGLWRRHGENIRVTLVDGSMFHEADDSGYSAKRVGPTST